MYSSSKQNFVSINGHKFGKNLKMSSRGMMKKVEVFETVNEMIKYKNISIYFAVCGGDDLSSSSPT